jgi:hypothetical protein
MLDEVAVSGSCVSDSETDVKRAWESRGDSRTDEWYLIRSRARSGDGPAINGAGLMKPPPRRREQRFEAVEDKIWIQWWQGEEYLGRAARLVNVSRHGAMIVSTFLFQERQSLRMFLEEPAPQIGVGGIVLGVVEGWQGVHQVRLGFDIPCPDAFVKAAANGFESWLSGERSRAGP